MRLLGRRTNSAGPLFGLVPEGMSASVVPCWRSNLYAAAFRDRHSVQPRSFAARGAVTPGAGPPPGGPGSQP